MRNNKVLDRRHKGNTYAWHFCRASGTLRYGDRRPVVPGLPLSIPEGRSVRLCRYGMHASTWLVDALKYGPTTYLTRVRVTDELQFGFDKLAGRKRTAIWVLKRSVAARAMLRGVAVAIQGALPDAATRHHRGLVKALDYAFKVADGLKMKGYEADCGVPFKAGKAAAALWTVAANIAIGRTDKDVLSGLAAAIERMSETLYPRRGEMNGVIQCNRERFVGAVNSILEDHVRRAARETGVWRGDRVTSIPK